jgi:hypothetical protein
MRTTHDTHARKAKPGNQKYWLPGEGLQKIYISEMHVVYYDE